MRSLRILGLFSFLDAKIYIINILYVKYLSCPLFGSWPYRNVPRFVPNNDRPRISDELAFRPTRNCLSVDGDPQKGVQGNRVIGTARRQALDHELEDYRA